MSIDRSLRIAYILPSFAASDDDWCIPVIRNFVEAMAAHHTPIVYALHYPYQRLTYSARGVTVHCLSNGKQGKIRRLMLWRDLQQQVARHHRDQPFDIIHAFWGTETGYFATHIAKKLALPSIVSLAGGELAAFPQMRYGAGLYAWLRYFVRRSMQDATCVTVGSPWLADKVPDDVRNKLIVAPLGVDAMMFAPGNVRTGSRLISVASVIALKDYPTLLRAIDKARRDRPDLHLDIAGYQDATEMKCVMALVDALGLNDAVSFLGEVRHDLLPAIMREHDLLIHASHYEAQGMAILEALATGMPIISTNVGIAASLPDNLVMRTTPGDIDAMARAILRSLDDRRRFVSVQRDGPELIQETFSLQSMSEQFLALYTDVENRENSSREILSIN